MGTLFSDFWVIFSFSFLVALTGAMSPGPLFTYTIIRSAQAKDKGYLMGLWIITGHALLELGIIIVLLMGFSFVLQNAAVVTIIGVGGGLILVWFGLATLLQVYRGPVGVELTAADGPRGSESVATKQAGLWANPVLGGIMVSMSNPYWWIWWATIGLALMIQFNVSWESWPGLVAFFLGHEAGDLLWYMAVSALSFFGLRRISPRAYSGILIACGVFMILFGLYLGISVVVRHWY